MRRWHQRLQEIRAERSAELSVADLDLVFAFFQAAYHLRDWVLNDGGAPRAELDVLIHESLALRVCRDLCLGSKHLSIQRPSVDPNASLVREYVPRSFIHPAASGARIFVVADGKHELWPLVDDCLAAWEAWRLAGDADPERTRLHGADL